MDYHLAQINVGRLIAPVDDPKIAEFVAGLAPINALADRAPGFVWRLQSDSQNATDIAYNDDPFMMVNMSVWQSIEACAISPTARTLLAFSATVPSGLSTWTNRVIACDGSLPGIDRRLPRGANGRTVSDTRERRRFRFGFQSSFRSRRMRVFSFLRRGVEERKNGWQR
jgi:hypothetical protein